MPRERFAFCLLERATPHAAAAATPPGRCQSVFARTSSGYKIDISHAAAASSQHSSLLIFSA